MPLRKRGKKWSYRFKIDGRTYTGPTDLAATTRNQRQAEAVEHEHRKAILEGRQWAPRLVVRLFSDATEEFLQWAEVENREHPNTCKRLATSFASLRKFLGKRPVGQITSAVVDDYKAWRLNIHQVREITLRHDLHALSKFFKWAWNRNYARVGENPVDGVKIPSDADAVRMHVLTAGEERLYFACAVGNLRDCGLVILNQGMRPEEVLSLQKTDVDLERGMVRVGKGKTKAARRELRLTAEARSIVAKRMNGDSRWIFPSPTKPGGT